MGMIWTNHACLYYEHASVVVFGLVYNAQVEGMEICIPPASAIILQWFKQQDNNIVKICVVNQGEDISVKVVNMELE